MQQPDPNNTRSFCNSALTQLQGEDAKCTYLLFHEFETFHGDLAMVSEVERRMKEALHVPPLELMVRRFSFQDLLPCSDVALKTMGVAITPSSSSSSSAGGGGAASAGGGSRRAQHNGGGAGAGAGQGSSYITRTLATEASQTASLPDLQQMQPFRPNRSLPRGIVCPPVIKELLSQLPPPNSFVAGLSTMVRTDVLMQELSKKEVPMPSVQSEVTAVLKAASATDAARASKRKADVDSNNLEEETDVFQQRLKASRSAAKTSA